MEPSDAYSARRDQFIAGTEILDEVRGTIAAVDAGAVLRADTDATIAFPRTHQEVFAGLVAPADMAKDAAALSIALKEYPGGAPHTVTPAPDGVTVTAVNAGLDWMLSTDPIAVEPNTEYLVSYDLTIDAGGTALHVMSGTDAKPIQSFYRQARQASTTERFLIYTGPRSTLRFVVTANNAYHPGRLAFGIQHLRSRRVTAP